MTAQAPDKIINHCSELDLDGLNLYRLRVDRDGKPSYGQSDDLELPECTLDTSRTVSTARYCVNI